MRQSYFEGSAYVPLLRRAYEGWHELAQESGRDLLRLCDGIYIGDPESPVFIGSLASARDVTVLKQSENNGARREGCSLR